MRPLLALGVLIVSGCGWWSDDRGLIVDRSDDYLDARDQPALLVPEDLSGVSIRQVMVIPPAVDQIGSETYPDQAPRPDGLYVREEAQTVRIQRLGDRSWLLIPQPPAVVWPKIKQFFADNGVELAYEVPESGRVDTRWLTVSSSASRGVVRVVISDGRKSAGVDSGRDRIMLRLEQGIRERTSEIHIRHENDATRVPGNAFPDASDIEAVETEMLSELGGYIAADVSNESVSFVATGISTRPKALMGRVDNGEPALFLYLDFARAWAVVNQSLQDAAVEILQTDREQAQIEARVTESNLNQEQKGWFRSLFDGDDNAVSVWVRLSPQPDRALAVTVQDAEDEPLDEDVTERILTMIREFAT